MIRGESPECHCFGQLHSEPAGWRTVARNAVLLLIAAFAAGAGWSNAGPSAVAWVGELSPTGVLALVGGLAMLAIAGLTAAAVLSLMRQNGRLLLKLDELETRLDNGGVAAAPRPSQPDHGLPVGSAAPGFNLSGLYGESVTLEALTAADNPVLLLFTDPECGPCNALLPRIAAWQRDHQDRLTIAVLTRGSADDNRAKIREHAIHGVWLDDDQAVYNAYEAIGTPGGVLVDAQGRIASAIVGGADAISALVEQAVGGMAPVQVLQVPAAPPAPTPVQPLPVGTDAPAIDLPDLAGDGCRLIDGDRDTLVLFWNPGCGFCQRMLDDVRAWESGPPEDAPRLVLISTGSAEDNRAMGLNAPILLDQAFSAGRAFGTTGTPSAMLVDPDGKIASGLAVGAPAVMELMDSRSRRSPH